MSSQPFTTCVGVTPSRRVWRNTAVPPGRAARPDAASSVAPVPSRYERSLRPCLGTSIAPRRRALFRQTLLAESGPPHGGVMAAGPPQCSPRAKSAAGRIAQWEEGIPLTAAFQ